MTKTVADHLRELATAVITEERQCVGPEGPSSTLVYKAEAALAALELSKITDAVDVDVLRSLASEPNSVTYADECHCCGVMDPIVYTAQCDRCRAIQDSRENRGEEHG